MNTTSEYCSAFNPDESETVAYNNPRFSAYSKYGFLSLYPGYSAISHWHEECEFICILLSTELLCANKWFLQNYVEHITANPCLPYLYLNGSGWQKEILCRLDQMHRCFNTDSIEALSYFEMGHSHYLCHEASSSQKPCHLAGFG